MTMFSDSSIGHMGRTKWLFYQAHGNNHMKMFRPSLYNWYPHERFYNMFICSFKSNTEICHHLTPRNSPIIYKIFFIFKTQFQEVLFHYDLSIITQTNFHLYFIPLLPRALSIASIWLWSAILVLGTWVELNGYFIRHMEIIIWKCFGHLYTIDIPMKGFITCLFVVSNQISFTSC